MIGARRERKVEFVRGFVGAGVEAESEVKERARTAVMMMVIVFILLFCLGLMKQIYYEMEGVYSGFRRDEPDSRRSPAENRLRTKWGVRRLKCEKVPSYFIVLLV